MADPVSAVREAAHPLTGAAVDYDPLMELVGGARFVLLGEASHGTHEFYRERAQITKRLIEEKGFSAVAVEADWPDAYRVNRYVRGRGGDQSSVEALSGFKRFPQWMWRNADVLDFVGWLRAHNDGLPSDGAKVGSMLAVILLGIMRVRKKMPTIFALGSMLASALSAYLMNRERANAEQSLGLIGAYVTGWLWLGLVSSLAVAAGAVISYLRRFESP